MSEARVTVVSPKFQSIAETIQKHGFAAIDSYQTGHPDKALSSLFALKAFAFGLPAPFDLSVELIEILANPDNTAEDLINYFLAVATAIIDFYCDEHSDPNKRIPHAISLQVLACALTTRLNDEQQKSLLEKLNALVNESVIIDTALDSPFDTLLYPTRMAFKAQGLKIPSAYPQTSESVKPQKSPNATPTKPDPKQILDDLNRLYKAIPEDRKVELQGCLSSVTVAFESHAKDENLTGQVQDYFDRGINHSKTTFMWIVGCAKSEDKSIRSAAQSCLRGISYDLSLPSNIAYNSTNLFFQAVQTLYDARDFTFAGELLQYFRSANRPWASSGPIRDFVVSLFEALEHNEDDEQILFALQFIHLAVRNQKAFSKSFVHGDFPHAAANAFQDFLNIPDEKQWNWLHFVPKSYATAAALAPFWEGYFQDYISSEKNEELLQPKIEPKVAAEANRWLSLRRISSATAAAGFVGSVIVCILLLALPPAIFSLALYPLIGVGLGSVALFIIGGLLRLYDATFGSHSQESLEAKLNQAQVAEAYKKSRSFAFNFFNTISESKIQGTYPLKFPLKFDIQNRFNNFPTSLNDFCPNNIQLLKPFFSDLYYFKELMSHPTLLNTNSEGDEVNALLITFLLNEMKEVSLEAYQKTAMYAFLNGPFQALITGLSTDKIDDTLRSFFQRFIEEVAEKPLCIMQLLQASDTNIDHLKCIIEYVPDDTIINAIFDIFLLTENKIDDFPDEATKMLARNTLAGDACFVKIFNNIHVVRNFMQWLQNNNLSTCLNRMSQVLNGARLWKLLSAYELNQTPFSSKLAKLHFREFKDIDTLKKLFLKEDQSVNYQRIQPHIWENNLLAQGSEVLDDRRPWTPFEKLFPDYALLFEILSLLETGPYTALNSVKSSLKVLNSSKEDEDAEIYQFTLTILIAAVEHKLTVDNVDSVELKTFGKYLQECNEKIVNKIPCVVPSVFARGEGIVVEQERLEISDTKTNNSTNGQVPQ